MRRREFLETSVVGGVAASLGPVLVSPSRRPGPGPEPPAVPAFELEEVTVAQLQDGMRSGRWTAKRIVELYLERIEQLDRGGPRVNSVIELNPDAQAIAESLDAERRSGKLRGPLHGIPILIKDNIDTADRMRTSAGSLALAESTPPRDAFIVERLRAAGLVLLGKVNLSEWANFRSTHSSSGWSGRGGQTRNPYVLDRNPCGSSSGSGAACSANFAALAIGTETDGSIVCPSSINGLVGVKPTVGLWSRSGIIPISATQDTAGPMCRTVTDAAMLLGALAGVDQRDAATAASRGHARADYAAGLDAGALKGARIGVARKGFGFSDKVEAVFKEVLVALKDAGALLVDPADVPDLEKQAKGLETELMLFEFKAGVQAYLASLGPKAPARTLKDLIEFNEKNRDREMPFFGQENFLKAETKGPLTDPRYFAAKQTLRRASRTQGLDLLLARHRLDAIVAMTIGPAWPIDLVNGDRFTGGSTSVPAVAGYPDITLPAGQVHGLPVGLSFFGAAWSEAKLLRYAYAFEQATKARKPPAFLATLPT